MVGGASWTCAFLRIGWNIAEDILLVNSVEPSCLRILDLCEQTTSAHGGSAGKGMLPTS